ncbi:MAG: DUF3047 domain-containing protein [Candidatus Omnitrophica bacterium]|nr:DUF3047 domain-containing protein [Candidatus Omnitrophota bacterium]
MRKNRIFLSSIVLFMMIALAVAVIRYVKAPLPIEVIKHFPFSKENSLKEWKEKIFKGRVEYNIKKQDHESFVFATSRGTASALFYKITLDIKKRPVISWRWNTKKFPAKDGVEDLKNAKQDDFSARVYVIFPAFFFTNSRAIEYIWAEKIKEGTISPSPYSRNLQLIVVESGGREEEWVSEERDIYEDYIKAFGEEPRYNIGAIAFMTDADSTKSTAEAFYDEIKIGYKKEEK